jgi:hypothetical protein
MPGPNPTPPPEESAEDRDTRVAAENEKARLARDVELAKTEYANALRVHGYDRDIPAEVERAFEQPSASEADDDKTAQFVPGEPGQTGE